MDDLLGFVSVSMVWMLTYILAKKEPSISNVLYVAFLLRAFASIFNFYTGQLPEAGLDAQNFEALAWLYSQDEFSSVLFRYPDDVPHGYIISWIISVLYFLTDRSLLMAQSLSTMFGVSSVYLGWILMSELWSRSAANKGVWVLALFPSWVLYSSLVMREAYIYFFITFAILSVVRWSKSNKMYYLFMSFFGFLAASLFHGAMVIGLIAFIVFVIYKVSSSLFASIISSKLPLRGLILLAIFILFMVFFFSLSINIPYIGALSGINSDLIINRSTITAFGTSAFPLWLIPSGLGDLVLKAPLRAIYFMFSPFPWDFTKVSHIIGFIDGIFYFIFILILYRNYRNLLNNRASKILLVIFVSYIIVFSMGIGNSGAAMRHRSKFLPIIVVLITPYIPKVRFSGGDNSNRVISGRVY